MNTPSKRRAGRPTVDPNSTEDGRKLEKMYKQTLTFGLPPPNPFTLRREEEERNHSITTLKIFKPDPITGELKEQLD